MRTLHFACITLVATHLAAATSLANTCAVAQAGGAVPWDHDENSEGYVVSALMAGTYDWSYTLEAHAQVSTRGSDPAGCYATAYASATVSGVVNDSVTAAQFVNGEFGLDTDDDMASASGTATVAGPTALLIFDEQSAAEAAAGSTEQAYARGYTVAGIG